MPEVTMPRLSDTMQEGTITQWLKKPGDQVKKGDTLAEVETDKATMEIEAYDNGVLENIMVQEGETAPIGQPIAVIGSGEGTQKQAQPEKEQQQKQSEEEQPQAQSEEKTEATIAKAQTPPQDASTKTESSDEEESPSKGDDRNGATAQASAQQSSQQSVQQERPHVEGSEDGAKIKVSPLARRIAEEHNIDLHQIQGTGPGGRIVRDDLEDYLEQQRSAPAPAAKEQAAPSQAEAPAATQAVGVQAAPPPDSEAIKLSQMQKAVARRLTESKQSIPHFYVSNDIDMTDVLALRQTLNSSVDEGGVKVSVNDLIVKACAIALEKFPEVNSSFRDGQFLRHKHINIGIAVDIPAGLIVPVIRDVNIRGVRGIARESKRLIEKARASKLTPEEMSGGTFTVSNLGMMGVTEFVAVINPPEAAILAVASTRKQFVPIDNQPVVRDIMPVTISADHRILYGATVARFLQEIKNLLQNPYTLLG